MTPSEEAFSKRWSNDCVHVVRLEDGSFAVLDRLFFVRGLIQDADDPNADVPRQLMSLIEHTIDNPPLPPNERHCLEKEAERAQALKDLGL